MSEADDIDELIEEADELINDDYTDDRADDTDDRADDDLPDTNDAPQVEVIEDDESYIQSQRLKDIFAARQAVRQQRLKMKIHSIDSNTPTERRNAKRVYRAAIENYLSEIRPVFLDDEQGRNVWFNLDFGTLKIALPTQTKTYGRGRTKRVYEKVKPNGETTNLSVNKPPEPKEIDLNGLNYLFELPEPISVEFEWFGTSKGLNSGTTKHTEVITHHIGFDRLDSVMNEANDRLRKRGLDLDLGEDNATAEFDYSDIV